ncbi:MAG: phage holin family protein [Microbacteriaceae bacterium]
MSSNETPKRSLFTLIGNLPGYIVDLVKSELEQLKTEIIGKLKLAGIGIGAFVVAGVFAFFAIAVLVAAGVLGLATVLPGWAAALIVAGVLLVITAILAAVGINLLKKGAPPTPTDTIASVKEDVNALKGTGKRD